MPIEQRRAQRMAAEQRRERRRLERERSRERFEREKERERHHERDRERDRKRDHERDREILKQRAREQAKSIQSRSTSPLHLINFAAPIIPSRPDTPDSISRGGSRGLQSLRGSSKNATGFEHLEQVTISRDNTADENLRRSASFAYLGSKLAVCHETSLKPKSIRATLPAGTQNTIQATSPAASANVLRGGIHTCPHEGCGKSFTRQHSLKAHMTRIHRNSHTKIPSYPRNSYVEDADDDGRILSNSRHLDTGFKTVRYAGSWNENDIRYHSPPVSEASKRLGRAGLSSSHTPRLSSISSVASTPRSRTPPAPASDSRSRKRIRSIEFFETEALAGLIRTSEGV